MCFELQWINWGPDDTSTKRVGRLECLLSGYAQVTRSSVSYSILSEKVVSARAFFVTQWYLVLTSHVALLKSL